MNRQQAVCWLSACFWKQSVHYVQKDERGKLDSKASFDMEIEGKDTGYMKKQKRESSTARALYSMK